MPARLFCQLGALSGVEFSIETEASLGRRPDNDIVLPYDVVSSHHARIRYDARAACYVLEDLNSLNGTRVDGVLVTSSVSLRNGQRISIADEHVFLFQTSAEAKESAGEARTTVVAGTRLLPSSDRTPELQPKAPRAPVPSRRSGQACAWLTSEVVRSIEDCENLVVRNLQVTQGYYRLSEAMRRLVGGRNVSWCTFATHASKTAGQALRHELMPRFLKSAMIRLAGYDDTYFYLDEVLGHAREPDLATKQGRLAEAMKRVSLLVSEGNITVFAELARPFVGFVDAFSEDRRYDAGKLSAFIGAHFRRGPLERNGQDYLIEAFSSYLRARFARDQKRRAEYVLLGNLLVGLHEQTRLQPQIEQALAVPLDVFGSRGTPGQAGAQEGGHASKRLRHVVTRATTQMLMSITLPNRALRLNHDVIAPTGVDSFPSELLRIENPRCRALVRRFEGRSDTLTGSAAENWVSLQQRMRFVVDFFRSYQQYERLWEPPFLPRQAPVIETGHLPAGPL